MFGVDHIAAGITDPEAIKVFEGLMLRAHEGMALFLNEAADEVLKDSQEHVPKSLEHVPRFEVGYPEEPLVENVDVVEATPESLEAYVMYGGPYAAAQEAGKMTYMSRSGKEVEWQAESYTTPGTGAHYLEDAGKAVMVRGEEQLSVTARLAMEAP